MKEIEAALDRFANEGNFRVLAMRHVLYCMSQSHI